MKRNKEQNPDVHGKYCLSKLHLTKYNLLSTSEEKNKFHKQYLSKLRSGTNERFANNMLNDNPKNMSVWSSDDDRIEDNEDDKLNNLDKLNNESNDKWRSNRPVFKYNGTVIQNTVFENVSRLGLEDFFQHIHAFRVGICSPSTCTNSDINIFLNKSKLNFKFIF